MADNARGRFLWHELMTADPKAAIAFYGKVVGWAPQAYEKNPDYTLLACGRVPMAGIMRHEGPRQWLCYIGTPNVDVTAREAVQLGGTVVKPAADIPDVGRFAIISDPQGAMFVAYQPIKVPAANDKPGLGDFSWHELITTDPQAGWNFYEKLFGWRKTDAMEMAPGQTYQMFAAAGKNSIGGIFKKAAEMPGPSQWLPYAVVKDSKAAAKTIATVGGTVVNGPMEVPGGDWIVGAVDPQGVMFAVHSKKQAAAAKPASATKKAEKTSKPAKSKPAKKKPAKKKAAKATKKVTRKAKKKAVRRRR
jgi:predicted enzyme related to lactoylglutathione lyase